ncbi:uncharacterized protein LOC143547846 [Bidens hawaiensis]|uniref:uncharacterized protein LOC143547846 n=1 Tax=Bidens hawaiensis TaxID=980011 RepID=UPI00404B4712
MENYENPAAQIDANARPVKESRWKRIRNEVNGRSERCYKHQVSPLLCKSYAELDRLYSEDVLDVNALIGAGFGYGAVSILFKLGVSALEFDTKGTNLASVTRMGCLTVHKFESLCSHRNGSDQLKHFPLYDGKFDSISAVRWNPSKQDEIAYTSFRSTQLRIIDIELSQEVQVLSKSSDRETEELSDIAFLNDGMRVLASDTRGVINTWDRRANNIPQRLLTTKKITGLTSIQILGDHCVYGAGRTGFIYVWDLRRMRSSPAASLSDWEIHSIPLTSIDLGLLLKPINPRKTRRDRRPKELHAININPSCPYQLAFHLDNGCDAKNPHENAEDKRSIFVSLSKNVTACAVHPLNGTIVVGALDGSLLTVSQKHIGKKGDGDNDHDVEQS